METTPGRPPLKWQRVQTVIWLDFSFLRTLFQAIQRAFSRAWSQREIWSGTGNRESFLKSFFSRNSVILWTITSFHKRRKKYATMIEGNTYPEIHFVRLGSPSQCRAFLAQLKKKVAKQAED